MITVKRLRELPGFLGTGILYKLSEPIGFDIDYETDKPEAFTDHVVISTVYVGYSCNRWETYIFPATPEGKVINWGELPGSMNYEQSQEAVISRAGWKLE